MFTLPAVLLKFLSKSSFKPNNQHQESISRTMLNDLPNVLFVLGGPGAGKGTQCANLVKDYRFIHLSAGDLLRSERNSDSKDGELIQHYIKEGKIVPAEITVRLIAKAMNENPGCQFLVDGFPRSENNLHGWNKEMHDKANVKGVLFFSCPEQVCVNRILERAKTSGRVDDNEESLKKRFQTFYNETMPVIDYFRERNLVMNVNAIPEPDEVYENVKTLIGTL